LCGRTKFCAAGQSFVRPDKVLFGRTKFCSAGQSFVRPDKVLCGRTKFCSGTPKSARPAGTTICTAPDNDQKRNDKRKPWYFQQQVRIMASYESNCQVHRVAHVPEITNISFYACTNCTRIRPFPWQNGTPLAKRCLVQNQRTSCTVPLRGIAGNSQV
jgi:hypothetical protein